MLKVLGISGTLREKGNTEYLVDYALSRFDRSEFNTELVSLKDLAIQPCNGCYDCVEAKGCTITGDDFGPVYKKMVKADGLIVGSPVYYSGAHPQLMSLFERAGFARRI